MIKLETDYYCSECRYFDPKILKKYKDTCFFVIKCKSKEKCNYLYNKMAAIEEVASIDPDKEIK